MTGPAGHWPGGPEGEGHGHQGCMPYPAKGGMPPGNPPNGINGENGIMELGLGAGVATGVIEDAPEGVDEGVGEELEATVPDESTFLGIGRALAAEKWVDHKGGANLSHLLIRCYIFLVLK